VLAEAVRRVKAALNINWLSSLRAGSLAVRACKILSSLPSARYEISSVR